MSPTPPELHRTLSWWHWWPAHALQMLCQMLRSARLIREARTRQKKALEATLVALFFLSRPWPMLKTLALETVLTASEVGLENEAHICSNIEEKWLQNTPKTGSRELPSQPRRLPGRLRGLRGAPGRVLGVSRGGLERAPGSLGELRRCIWEAHGAIFG